MASTVKSKDRTSSAGQKFWHLKKLALGKTNTNSTDQPLQRPPSPAESAFSVDTASLCDEESPKPRSKRLSVLLSNRRQGNNGKVAPAKAPTMPTAMSVQNLHALSSNPSSKTNNMTRQAGTPRPRTMSHTVGASSAQDTRAAFLRSREGPGLTRHASVRDMKSRASGERLRPTSPPMCSKPNAPEEVVDPAQHPILTKKRSSLPTDNSNKPANAQDDLRRTRTLRPAASFASLRSRRSQDDAEEWSPKNITLQQSPPPTPTSPRLARSNTVQNLSPSSPRTATRPSRARGLPPAAAAPNNTKPEEEMSSSTEELSWSRSSDEDAVNKEDDGESTDLSSDSDHNPKRSEAYWRNKLDKERAVVKALQRQKEACNKDIAFLSQSVDDLTNEKQSLLKQFEDEKISKGRFQDDLLSVTDKLNEATKQIKQLMTEKSELEESKIELERSVNELEKSKSELESSKNELERTLNDQKSSLEQAKSCESLTNEKLQAQLRHSQDQVRVLKATMEQFLRMGIFNEDMSLYGDIASKYSTTNKSSSVEMLVQEQRSEAKPNQQETKTENNKKETAAEIKSVAELDMHLRELLREKELLQAEYSKIPISGVNALTRRRKEELEARLDQVDSQMSKMKLKYRDFIKK
ncbi:hypothetical protein BJV82DRAFT_607435 [Fennellomyces sp. T-0311]|nr:hypothetical protein BJV82DRAFT_607435 [Fennellomyces sp. T-0311]